MAELKKVNTRIIHKHATAAVWHEKQFIPLQGEIIIYDPGYDPKDGVTYTYERMKVGDGTRKVTDLPFVSNVSDWNQLDETAPDYIKNRTHYEDLVDADITLLENKSFNMLPDLEEEEIYGRFQYVGPEDVDYTKDIEDIKDNCNIVINNAGNIFKGRLVYDNLTESFTSKVLAVSGSIYDFCGEVEGYISIKNNIIDFTCSFFSGEGRFYSDKISIIGTKKSTKQLDEKFIPDTIARVDHYDKYDKDSFSANDTAKAISAKSAAFGFNTQAGSYAFTVLDLDATNKTFTLDSTEGLDVGDVYTVDLSFYNASDVAVEELYENYGKITAISADNVVTVDTFPSDVARYRVSDEPYIDENGLDGEENVFRVIAKPNVGNRAIGTKTFATGNGSKALSKNAVAMGAACIAYGAHSVAIGYDNKTTYAATSFGRENTASGHNSVAIGYKNTSSGNFTIAIGQQNTSTTKGAVAMGILNKASTRTSIALGERNTADGEGAIALGYNNISSGERTFAGGHINKVQGKYSIALGYNNTSSGEGSIAFGNSNTSSNKGSFASGTSNKATGTNSFALGSANRATGTSSFAHGYNNDATQTGSAVFGTNSKSQGGASFAAGAHVEATGYHSQAFGQNTKAIGACSFAEGEGTIAKSRHQHVQGKYNIEDAAIKYAHIIGNGTDDENRKNIYTVDWNGNGWFAGSLTVGPDKDSIATMNDVNNKIEDTLLETLYINCGTASDLID